MIYEYVRNGKNQKVGVVVATSAENIGWSYCSPKDKFNRLQGISIALGRAWKNPVDCYSDIPNRKYLFNAIMKMADRAEAYFQNDFDDSLDIVSI